jgi:hypothetical protein
MTKRPYIIEQLIRLSDGNLKPFDTTNPAAKYPAMFTVEYVCRYCGVDYTNIHKSNFELAAHVKYYHRRDGRQFTLDQSRGGEIA